MPSKVLIIGVCGFTGRYLAAELAQNSYAVFGIGSPAREGEGYFQADLEDGGRFKHVLAEVQPEWSIWRRWPT